MTDDLLARLEYHCAVNRVLIQAGWDHPLLGQEDVAAMRLAFTIGIPADDFAHWLAR